MKKNQGFTLIEIVLVLVLMGILSAMALSKYYDLEMEAKIKAAHAALNVFCEEVNHKAAQYILEGKTCQEAMGDGKGVEDGTGNGALAEVASRYFNDRLYHGGNWLFQINPEQSSEPSANKDNVIWVCHKTWTFDGAVSQTPYCLRASFDELPLLKCNK